jgi:hypothetical protein
MNKEKQIMKNDAIYDELKEEFWDERITKEDIEFAVKCEEEKWEMYNYDKGV